MKFVYVIVGLGLLAGVGYASYYYGTSRGVYPAPDNTANIYTNTTTPSVPSINLNDFSSNTATSPANTQTTTPPANTYAGATYITVSSPANGEILTFGHPSDQSSSYTFRGTVSPNATKIIVSMYSTGYWDGLDGTSYEKKLDEYTLSKFKPGDTSWSYVVSAQYNNLVGDNARLVAKAYFTGGSIKQAEVRVTYSYTDAEMGKPVIYLYPTSTQQVVVNVKPTSGISYSEPVISANGWRVTAQPDGTLTDASGQTWPYLFWEGFATDFATPKEGFVVEQSEVSQFFSNKLSQLGLNTTEIADFKEFWLPRLSDKPYYFITFIPQAAFDSYAPLTVIPTPQTVIRVFFDYCGLDQPMVVAPQILPPTPARVGFTAVEWGGRLYR